MRFELGLTMAEIARHVGVTISSIAKEVTRFEKDGMMTDSYGIRQFRTQRPLFLLRRKNVLIAYQKLVELAGFESYNTFREAHKKMVNEALSNGNNHRQTQWTESIAVGSKSFIETIKEKLGTLAKGRKILENDGGFQLREETRTYIANYDSENGNIGVKNAYFWDIILNFQSLSVARPQLAPQLATVLGSEGGRRRQRL